MVENNHTENFPKPEIDKSHKDGKDEIKNCHPTDINKVL